MAPPAGELIGVCTGQLLQEPTRPHVVPSLHARRVSQCSTLGSAHRAGATVSSSSACPVASVEHSPAERPAAAQHQRHRDPRGTPRSVMAPRSARRCSISCSDLMAALRRDSGVVFKRGSNSCSRPAFTLRARRAAQMPSRAMAAGCAGGCAVGLSRLSPDPARVTPARHRPRAEGADTA